MTQPPTIDPLMDELLAMPSPQRLAAVAAQPDRSAAVDTIIEQASSLIGVDVARAMAATDMAVALSDEFSGKLERARARRSRARALCYAGRFDAALDDTSAGIELAEQAGSAIEAGRARLASMHALGELGRLEEAIAVGEAARQAFIGAGEPALAARADINLGITHQRHDEPAMAVACFERAREALNSEPKMLGHLENSRGEALVALNDFGGAERAFRAAQQVFLAAGLHTTAAIAEGNLADLAARQGRLQRSLWHFEQSRRMMESDRSPAHLARLLAERAEAINVLGLPADALQEYQRSLPELDRCGLALESARARRGMGKALLRLGRWAEAETALAAAALAFDELGHATAKARVDLLRAELSWVQGRPTEARAMLLRAQAALHDRPADLIVVRHQLAQLAVANDQLDQADAELAAAVTMAIELDMPPLLADVLTLRGRLRRRQGRLAEAAADLAQAVAQIERVHSAIQAERLRAAFLGGRASSYEWLVATLLDIGNDDSIHMAFATAEQAKSRQLREQIARAISFDPDHHVTPTDASALALHDAAERERSALSALYSRAADHRFVDAAAWRATVRQHERRVEDLETRLATTQGAIAITAPAALEDVQRLLGPDQVMLEYFIVADEILAFAVSPNSVRVHRGLTDARDMPQLLQQLQFQVSRALRPGALAGLRAARLTNDTCRVLGELYDRLLAPLQGTVEDARLVTVVPHGVLHLVPFHALWNGRAYANEHRAFHICPSAGLLAQLHRACDGDDVPVLDRPLLVGVPDQLSPQMEQEAALLASVLATHDPITLLGSEATVDSFMRQVTQGSATTIHLACHGRFSAEHPMGSGLRFNDRWLTLRDLCGLRLQARLVTLSGCETGVNLVNAGDEVMGLLRGFFAAGAKSTLATLWRVDDQITREFMGRLYGLLHSMDGSSGALAQAVQRARIDLMASHPHPAFWAPFFLAGRS